MARHWSKFPPAYTETLLHFQATGGALFGPLPLRNAMALRADLYRFREAVNKAAEAGDEGTFDYLEPLAEMTISIEEVGGSSTEVFVYLKRRAGLLLTLSPEAEALATFLTETAKLSPTDAHLTVARLQAAGWSITKENLPA